MRDIAEAFAASHRGLDFTLESLRALESLLDGQRKAHKKKSIDPEVFAAWGAYLGETIVRAGGGEVKWVSFAQAAKQNKSVAAIGEDEATAHVLQHGKQFWFPLVKVQKFLSQGRQESVRAFAGAIVGLCGDDDEPEPTSLSDFKQAHVKAVKAFIAVVHYQAASRWTRGPPHGLASAPP